MDGCSRRSAGSLLSSIRRNPLSHGRADIQVRALGHADRARLLTCVDEMESFECDPPARVLGIRAARLHRQPPRQGVGSQGVSELDRQPPGAARALDAGLRLLVVEPEVGHIVLIVDLDLEGLRHAPDASNPPRRSNPQLLRIDVDCHFPLGRQEGAILAARVRVIGPAQVDPGPGFEEGRQARALTIGGVRLREDFIGADDQIRLATCELHVDRCGSGFRDRQRQGLPRRLRHHRRPEVDLDAMQALPGQLDLPLGSPGRTHGQFPGPLAGRGQLLIVQADRHPVRAVGLGHDLDFDLDLEHREIIGDPPPDPNGFDHPGRLSQDLIGQPGHGTCRRGPFDLPDFQVRVEDLLQERVEIRRGLEDHVVGGGRAIARPTGLPAGWRRWTGGLHRPRREGDQQGREQEARAPDPIAEEIQGAVPSRVAQPG